MAFDAVGDGRNGQDCNGHGTHVSGTVGGSTYGVAKAVRLFAVRVLNCSGSGTNSGVIAGVDWVTANHVSPAVANMSLGGGVSTALDTAVSNSINVRRHLRDRGGQLEHQRQQLLAGARRRRDHRRRQHQHRRAVVVLELRQRASTSSRRALRITSAWATSNTATNTISGTSMATPHVAGVAARFLQNNRTASAATVRNAIVNAATLNRLTGIPTGTSNRLLFWSGAQ